MNILGALLLGWPLSIPDIYWPPSLLHLFVIANLFYTIYTIVSSISAPLSIDAERWRQIIARSTTALLLPITGGIAGLVLCRWALGYWGVDLRVESFSLLLGATIVGGLTGGLLGRLLFISR
jgi:hypothetical protein